MHKNYIIFKDVNNYSSFYYKEKYGIYKSSGKKEDLILKKSNPYFTLSLFNNNIYVTGTNEQGDIVILNALNNYKEKVVLKNIGNKKNLLFYPLLNNGEMDLIYTLPLEKENAFYLIRQSNKNNIWSKADKLDKINPMPNLVFDLHQIGNNHYIAFYQKRTPEYVLGYVEFTSDKKSDFKSLCSTGYRIIDTSFLVTQNTIHIFYITKSLFSTKLIYKEKTDLGFSENKIIYDSNNITSCLAMIVKNTLYIFFISNGILYYSTKDSNNNFTVPEKYTHKYSPNLSKAIFLSYENQQEENYHLHTCYIDSLNPHDLQLLPDLL